MSEQLARIRDFEQRVWQLEGHSPEEEIANARTFYKQWHEAYVDFTNNQDWKG